MPIKSTLFKTLLILAFALPVLIAFTGCTHLAWQASQLPGLSDVSRRMNERAFIRRISGDPVVEVNYNIRQLSYRLKGLVDIESQEKWVPGLSADEYSIYHVTYFPIHRGESKAILAEKYFRDFNILMQEERRGKILDTYGYLVKN